MDDTVRAPCCAPVGAASPRQVRPEIETHPRSTRGQVRLPGGEFAMGDAFNEGYSSDGERPVHSVRVPAFHIDETVVTNAEFTSFVNETGYVTDSEIYGSSAVFHLVVAAPAVDVLGQSAGAPWWINVAGADWRHPEGPDSTLAARQNHPVVHVSWQDAQAYCAWAGKRLATEAEWEFAARGGLAGRRFAWGDELTPNGRWMCNIWQGDFPRSNTKEDGYLTTAPVRRYRPNGYGLSNMAGNVWEWCADWFSSDYYTVSPTEDPHGPMQGEERVMRGGSYLCHNSYCHRYRVAARASNTPDSSSGNLSFRAANDSSPET